MKKRLYFEGGSNMKNILAKFLDFILFIIIVIFCICISFKSISSSLMKEILSQSDAQTKVISLIQSVYPNLDNEKVNEIEERILENKDVENTINSYLNYYTSIASGNYVDIDPKQADWIDDEDSILKAKCAVQLKIVCTGGIYADTEFATVRDAVVTAQKEEIYGGS